MSTIKRGGELNETQLAAMIALIEGEGRFVSTAGDSTVDSYAAGVVTWALCTTGYNDPANGGTYVAQWNTPVNWMHGGPARDLNFLDPPPYWTWTKNSTIRLYSSITTYYDGEKFETTYEDEKTVRGDWLRNPIAIRVVTEKCISCYYYFDVMVLLIERTEKIYEASLTTEDAKPEEKKDEEETRRRSGKGTGGSSEGSPTDTTDPDKEEDEKELPDDTEPDGVTPRPTKLTTDWPASASVATNRAPIPIVYGTHLLGGNYLWISHPRTMQLAGDKSAVRYVFDLGICTGPVDELVSIDVEDVPFVFNKVRGVDGEHYVDVTLGDQGSARFYYGTAEQPSDPRIVAAKTIGYYGAYRYLCHAVVEIRATIKSEETLQVKIPSLFFTVRRTPDCGLTGRPNIDGGANPVDIVYDLMCSAVCEERFTMNDFEQATLVAAGGALGDEDLGLHLAYRQSMNITEAIRAVELHVGMHVRFNGEKYETILDRDDYDVDLVTEITNENASDLKIEKESTQDPTNECLGSFLNEDQDDKETLLVVRDTGAQATLEARRPTQVDLPGLTNSESAYRVLWRLQKNASFSAMQLTCATSMDVIALLPGDKIVATNDRLGLNRRGFKITTCRLSRYPLVSIGLVAKEDVWKFTDDTFVELGDLSLWSEDGGTLEETGLVPVTEAEQIAAGVSYPGIKVFELPYMDKGPLNEVVRLAVAVSKPAPYTAIGYELYVSTERDSPGDYKRVGVVRAFATQGEIKNNPFGAPMGPYDAQHTHHIAQNGPTFVPYCEYDAKYFAKGIDSSIINREQMAWLDGEWCPFMSIEQDLLDEDHRITRLGRTFLDGENGIEHAVGSELWLLSRGLFLLDATFSISETVYVRAVPFDLGHMRSLNECRGLAYVVQGVRHRPFSPINLRAKSSGVVGDAALYGLGPDRSPVWYAGDDVVLHWRRRSRGTGIRFQDFFECLANMVAHGDGTCEIDVYDPVGPVLKREVTGLNTDTWTYTQAMMAVDFGGEPSAVLFRVYQKDAASGAIEAMRSLYYAETTVEKV